MGWLWKSNQFEDVSPIKNGDFPLTCHFSGGVPFQKQRPMSSPRMSPVTSFWKGGIRTSKRLKIESIFQGWHTQNENPKKLFHHENGSTNLGFLQMSTVSGESKRNWTLCPRPYLKNFILGLIPRTNIFKAPVAILWPKRYAHILDLPPHWTM